MRALKYQGEATSVLASRKWNSETNRYCETRRGGTVEVTVDIETIVRLLVHQAIKNRSGKAVAMNGLIKARAISRTDPKVADER